MPQQGLKGQDRQAVELPMNIINHEYTKTHLSQVQYFILEHTGFVISKFSVLTLGVNNQKFITVH